jgi:hypothetical protein
MSGVGLIIILLQIWPFLGTASPKTTLDVFTQISTPLSQINWGAVLLGGITVAVYYLFPRLTKAVPSVLVALLAGTLASRFAGFDVPIIGDIPTGLPDLQAGVIFAAIPEHLLFVMGSGITLALLGSIDSLLTSVIADNVTKTRHNSRRELIGQGIGNTIAAMFGGIPGAGATKGTVVNITAGGRTRLSGVVHGLLLLGGSAWGGPFRRLHPAERAGGTAHSRRLRHHRLQGPQAPPRCAARGCGGPAHGARHHRVRQSDPRRGHRDRPGERAVHEKGQRFGGSGIIGRTLERGSVGGRDGALRQVQRIASSSSTSTARCSSDSPPAFRNWRRT